MNKNSIFGLAIVAPLALSLSLASCGDGSDAASDSKDSKVVNHTASTPPPSGDVKFAYVNTDTLSNEFVMIKDLEEDLLAEQTKMENQLQVMIRDLEKDYRDAQEGSAGLSQEALGILQQKLAQKEQSIQFQRQQMENQLMGMEQEKMGLYLDAVHEFLEDYAQDNAYHLIYGYNGLNNLLYIDKGYDITNEVVEALNTKYSTDKEQASLEKE